MIFKEITSKMAVRTKLLQGVQKLADVVSLSIGPRGLNVALEMTANGVSTMSKDGVTIAKEVILEDPVENMGCQFVKSASEKTATTAGDGTSGTVILAEHILKIAHRNIAAGAKPSDIKKGLDRACRHVVKEIKKMAIKVPEDQLQQVAAISANNDNFLGSLVGSAVSQTGVDGGVVLKDSNTTESYVDIQEGFKFSRGFVSPYFRNHAELAITEFSNPYFLLYNGVLEDLKAVHERILTPIAEKNGAIVIIAHDFSPLVLQYLVESTTRQFKVCCIKSPDFADRRAEIMKDLGCVLDGTVFDPSVLKLNTINMQHLGSCETITITDKETTLINGKGSQEAVGERIASIKELVNKELDDFKKEKLQDRIAALSGNVATIYCGGQTETAQKEARFRLEDALCAVRTSIETGICAGGGITYINAGQVLTGLSLGNDDQNLGAKILLQSLPICAWQVAENAGAFGDVVLDKILNNKSKNYGYNALTEKFEDLMKAGVIDPAGVLISVVENACSVAGQLIICDAAITTNRESIPQ